MKKIKLTKIESNSLITLSVIGILIPNGFFLYYFLTNPKVTTEALSNPISLVFIIEAFVLMFLFAWLLKKAEVEKPNGIVFIIMSLIGSMVFSVPLTICSIIKNKKKTEQEDQHE